LKKIESNKFWNKKNKSQRKILLTNYFMRYFTGSELVTFNLAKLFKSYGYEVTIATLAIDNPLSELLQAENINLLPANSPLLKGMNFDLIWSHHSQVLYNCLLEQGITASQVIYSCLGPFEPLEAPPVFINDLTLCLSNSYETKDKLITEQVNSKHIKVFPNSVEEACFKYRKNFNETLKKIIIVSNHIPKEVLQLADILRSQNIEVDIFGLGYRFEYISPELLLNYDVIITIGRTVQYALALGIPVFCYDQFGGPGFITMNNVKKEEYFNFSGRGSALKYTSTELSNMIINDYNHMSRHINNLRLYCKANFSLKRNVSYILKLLKYKKNINWKYFRQKYSGAEWIYKSPR
jgi:hypothetical protein